MEEKENFWCDLYKGVESFPREERVMIPEDFNGQDGERNRGDEEVMGGSV